MISAIDPLRKSFEGNRSDSHEVGAHFWWTPSLRLTAFGRYLITTEGRDADDWLLGGGLAFFTH